MCASLMACFTLTLCTVSKVHAPPLYECSPALWHDLAALATVRTPYLEPGAWTHWQDVQLLHSFCTAVHALLGVSTLRHSKVRGCAWSYGTVAATPAATPCAAHPPHPPTHVHEQ